MSGNPYYHGPPSGHFDGQRFFNPGQQSTDRSLTDFLRWRLLGKRTAWPASTIAVPRAKPEPGVPGLSITMAGHASVLIQVAGVNILADPVWSERASPVAFAGPRRWDPPGIAFEDLPPIHIVLISHNHYDHLDAATLRRLWATHRPRIVAPLGNDGVIARAVPGLLVETGDWGDRFQAAPGVTITLHPAYHWSARRVGDRRMALWCGFVIESPAGPIYLAGDTAYGDGDPFRAVRDLFGPPAVALLPIGAYEPRWFMRNQHVNPAEAMQIMLDTGAAQALGIHWGTFQLTDEARCAPVEALRQACHDRSIDPSRFRALSPGDGWTAGQLA